MASREFGVYRENLEKRRRALNILPDEKDGCFTSGDIAKMLFGDKEAEALAKSASERRLIDIQAAKLEGALARVSDFDRFLEVIFVPLRQEICSSSIPDESKDRVLEMMRAALERDYAAEINAIEKRR